MTPIIGKILDLVDEGHNLRYIANTLDLPLEFVEYAVKKYLD